MSKPIVIAAITAAILIGHVDSGRAQTKMASWLDESRPVSWNRAGQPIPVAPKTRGTVNPRCRELARPAQLEEDKRVRDRGWDLVGPYQGGWQMLVIRGTAGYDGMCRPQQYQDFVFVGGVFAGTLSPQPMDSRADGSLTRVSLEGRSRLTAYYQRYSEKDPLCCPSRTTTVVFNIPDGQPVARAVSMATTTNAVDRPSDQTPSASAAATPLEGTYWKAIEIAGRPAPTREKTREAYLLFQGSGRVSGSDGCNQLTGTYQRDGARVTFGLMAATQMACLSSSGTEQPFRDALRNATRLTVVGDRLELFDAKGTRLAAFAAESRGSSPVLGR